MAGPWSAVGEAKVKRSKAQPTINDVARAAGVSKKTVSRVINRSPLLNDDTRKRVLGVIEDLGYVPNPQARALALRRNFLIGLIHDNPNAQMVLNVQQGILEVLRQTEFELIVRPVDRGSPTMLADIRKFLEQQRPYGVMLLPPISENDELAELCGEIGCRYVRMGSAVLDEPEHMVASNDREAVREAVGFLVDAGHRCVGLVEGPKGFRSAHERLLGFKDALEAAAMPFEESLVADGNYTFDFGRQGGGEAARSRSAADGDLCLERRDGCRSAARSAAAGHGSAARPVDHRLRRYADSSAHLAAADHGSLADRDNGASRGAKARVRRWPWGRGAVAVPLDADPAGIGGTSGRALTQPCNRT